MFAKALVGKKQQDEQFASSRAIRSNVEMDSNRLVWVGQGDGGSLRQLREVALPVAVEHIGDKDELERLAMVQDVEAAGKQESTDEF